MVEGIDWFMLADKTEMLIHVTIYIEIFAQEVNIFGRSKIYRCVEVFCYSPNIVRYAFTA